MMNRQIFDGSYYSSTMPSLSMEESNHQKEQIWHLQSNSQSSISTFYNNTASCQQKYQFMPVLDKLPSFLSSNSLNLYLAETQPTHEFYTDFLRPVQERAGYDGLPIGLDLTSQSYISQWPTRNFDFMYWRSRGYLFGHQPPRCQAEGCKADLSNAKRYHRRHKVCELHSKATVVIVSGGLQQRFCQQCSRFHSLDEFDDAKKSCRKRLADHNRRRRKPQSPSSTSAQTANNVVIKKKPVSRSMQATKCSIGTSTAVCGDAKSSGQKGNIMKSTNLKIGSSLSLRGLSAMDMGYTSSKDQLNHLEAFDLFSNDASFHQHQLPYYPSNTYINQQNLSCSSSNDGLRTIGEGFELSHHQHHHDLHAGQVMFGMDFM